MLSQDEFIEHTSGSPLPRLLKTLTFLCGVSFSPLCMFSCMHASLIAPWPSLWLPPWSWLCTWGVVALLILSSKWFINVQSLTGIHSQSDIVKIQNKGVVLKSWPGLILSGSVQSGEFIAGWFWKLREAQNCARIPIFTESILQTFWRVCVFLYIGPICAIR